ncbi:MAG: protein kinase [Gemmatimonadetes bacterium]|nr:protein kinase [Gemmatimonadota bacterium]
MQDEIDRLNAALAGRYTIEDEVGRGGMATVYLARDRKHDRRVAVKVLGLELAAAIGAGRFAREIKIAAKLSHPHILPLHDSGKADEFLYYVMPYLDEPSLGERIRREGQLAIDEAVSITQAVAAGLDYAHKLGVIHRDIKPDNILFNAGEPMLADFGIALALDAADSDRLTETGLSVGTPAYMSPEQASGDSHIDERSDIYSLACVLYEMLVGQPPFVGQNIRAVLARHVTDPVPPLTTVRPSIGDALNAAAMKALHKVPMDRFATAADFANALGGSAAARDLRAEKTLVVVPFANLSGDAEHELFSDGLTEEIISGLSGIRSLQVVSRTSTMQLKGTTKNLRAIGRELNVRYVVEGSVRSAGDGLRITAQLVDAANDMQIWSERFGGSMNDALGVQEQVSRAIVDAVRLKLSPAESPVAGRPTGTNPHAQESYLRARRDIWRFTENAVVHALSYLQEAIEIVGEDILLYAGIAEAYYVFPQIGGNEPEACLERVRECAERIFDLDPDAAHGHCLHGLLCCKREGGLREGLALLQRACDLAADDPAILFWHAFYADESGLSSTAETAAERLMRVAPQAPRSHFVMGWHHLLQGRFDLAIEAYRKAHQLEPTTPQTRFYLGYVLAATNNLDAAIELFDLMIKETPSHIWARIAKFYKFALRNQRGLALKAVSPEDKQAARWGEYYSYHMAECFALIGETAQALEWFDNAVRRGFINHPYLSKHAPFLSGLRDEERFRRLLDGMTPGEKAR